MNNQLEESNFLSPILKFRNSVDPVHQETLAVLNALTAAIGAQTEQSSQQQMPAPIFYFAAILTALSERKQENQTIAVSRSMMYILNFVLPHIAKKTLLAKFADVSEIFKSCLDEFVGDTAALRHTIGCVSQLFTTIDVTTLAAKKFKAISKPAVALQRRLTALALTDRPKVRKRAAEAVHAVMTSSSSGTAPLVLITAMRRVCERAVARDDDADDAARLQNVIRVAALLKGDGDDQSTLAQSSLLFNVPVEEADQLLALLFRCALETTINEGTSNTNNVRQTAMFARREALSNIAAVLAAAPLSTFTTQCLNECLLLIVNSDTFSVKNLSNDGVTCVEYIKAVVNCAVLLSTQDETEKTNVLTCVSKQLIPFMLTSNVQISNAMSDALAKLFAHTLDDDLNDAKASVIADIVTFCADSLTAAHRHAWPDMLMTLASLASALGTNALPLLEAPLQQVWLLLDQDDVSTTAMSNDVRHAARTFAGAVIRSIGPSRFLAFQASNWLESDEDVPVRAWLLPLLSEHVSDANHVELALFGDMLTLLKKMEEKIEELVVDENAAVQRKRLQQRRLQIWALFPSMCNARPEASNVSTVFRQIAPVLGGIIENDDEVRRLVVNGLSSLIERNIEIIDQHNDDDDETIELQAARTNIAAIAPFAKNFLPLLVNTLALYHDPSAPPRTASVPTMAALGRCIGAYARVAPQKLVSAFVDSVLTQLDASIQASNTQKPSKKSNKRKQNDEMLDEPSSSASPNAQLAAKRFFLCGVAASLVPALSSDSVKRLYSILEPCLKQTHDRKLQKVAFRALESLCRDVDGFIASQWSQSLSKLLLTSLSSAVPAAKRARLACVQAALEHLVKRQRKHQVGSKKRLRVDKMVNTLLSEATPVAILCTSEPNVRTRNAALELLSSLADTAKCNGDDNGKDEFECAVRAATFVGNAAAGLAATTTIMMATTTRVLAYLARHYGSVLRDETLGELCDVVLTMLQSQDSALLRAAIGFVRAVLGIRPNVIEARLNDCMPALVALAADSTNNFRNPLKKLFQKLVVRLGFEAIAAFVPESGPIRRMMVNIRQVQARKAKRGDFTTDYDDDDSDSETDATAGLGFASKKRGKLVGKQQQQQHTASTSSRIVQRGDEPLDFLDTSSMHNVVASKRGKKRGRGRDDDDSDDELIENDKGLLVVPDDVELRRKSKRDRNATNNDIVDDDDDSIDDGELWAKRKDRLRTAINVDGTGRDKGVRGVGAAAVNNASQTFANIGKQTSNAAANTADQSAMSARARKRQRRLNARRQAVRAEMAAKAGKSGKKKTRNERNVGSSFASNKADGDVARGPLQPFAYVRMDPKLLSKKSKGGASQGAMAGVVKQSKKKRRQQ